MVIISISSHCFLNLEYELIMKNYLIYCGALRASLLCILPSVIFVSNESIAECSDIEGSCIFVNGGGALTFGKDNNDSIFLYHLGAGFKFNQYLDFGVSTVVQSEQIDLNGYARGLYEINSDVELYASVGLTTLGDNYYLGTGLLYHVSPKFDVDFGYHYYPNISEQFGDSYGLGLAIQYNFLSSQGYQDVDTRSSNENLITEKTPVEEKANRIDVVNGQVTCLDKVNNYVNGSYTIIQGDTGYSIAKKLCTNLDVLVKLNPWLSDRVKNDKYIYPGEIIIFP